MLVYRGVTTPGTEGLAGEKINQKIWCFWVNDLGENGVNLLCFHKKYSSMFMCRSSDIYIYIYKYWLFFSQSFLVWFLGLKGAVVTGNVLTSTPKDNCHIFIWFVVSTQLKNMIVKLDHFPNFRGENNKSVSCHHPVVVWANELRFYNFSSLI